MRNENKKTFFYFISITEYLRPTGQNYNYFSNLQRKLKYFSRKITKSIGFNRLTANPSIPREEEKWGD